MSTFFILRSLSEFVKASVELSWATLNIILALKKLLGGSLGAASGVLTAHNHSTDSIDHDLGALTDLLEALLVASRFSWSPLGVPETSRASKSDAQSSCGQISL